MGFLGALAGGAEALGNIATRRLDMEGKEHILQIYEKTEIAKEQRINEAAKANRSSENQYKIDAEIRDAERTKALRSDILAFNTNPDNVARVAQAKVLSDNASYANEDARFATKLDQEGQLFRAKIKPESELDKLEQQARIVHLTAQASVKAGDGISNGASRASVKAGDGISDGASRALKAINAEITLLKTGISEGELSPGDSGKAKTRIFELEQHKLALMPSPQSEGDEGDGEDYAELGNEKEKQTNQEKPKAEDKPGIFSTQASAVDVDARAKLLKQAEQLYPNNTLDHLSDKELRLAINRKTGKPDNFGMNRIPKGSHFKPVDSGM